MVRNVWKIHFKTLGGWELEFLGLRRSWVLARAGGRA